MFLKLIKSLPVFIGAYTIASNGYSNFRDAYNHFYRTPINFLTTYGDQAYFVITGVNEGLGRSFAREIAVKGIPLILISPNEEELKSVKAELERDFNTMVRIIPFDFSQFSLANYENLLAKLNNFDISGLINNAGTFIAKDFGKMDQEEIFRMVDSNIIPNVLLSHYALTRFAQRNSPFKSMISTTSSTIGTYPHPHLSLFTATKAFNSSFMKSIIGEKPKNVDLHLLEPGLASNGAFCENFPKEWRNTQRKWMISPTDEVAEESVRRFGQEKLIYGTFRHWFNHSLMRNCEALVNYLNEGVFLNI